MSLKHSSRPFISCALVFIALCTAQTVSAQGTAFTYQGKLSDGGNAANGSYDMQFKLFDLVSGGAQQGSTLTVTNITVAAGIFTVQLDFGACPSCFDGTPRYFEITVKKTTDPTYTTLNPRQPVSSTPYALRSLNAATADGLSVACINCITSSQIQSVNGSAVTGTIPVGSVPQGSGFYVQNGTSLQASTNFNISGNGAADTFNAATQYNLNGQRVLSAAGTFNLFAGIGAGSANTGVQNSFFGSMAGQSNTSGISNSFFGTWAGRNNTADSNSFFGAFSGRENTTGIQNAFFGYQAGVLNHTGCCNAFFGYDAGLSSQANDNSFFGNSAGLSNTTGSRNSFFGSAAGYLNQTGSDNTFFGVTAGENNKASFNTFVGSSAGVSNTSGELNSFFGLLAGSANTTQHDNTFVGHRAGQSVGTSDTDPPNANWNTFVGSNSGRSATTGCCNTFIGQSAGSNNSTASFNTLLGDGSGRNTTTGCCNIFAGQSAGLTNNTGSGNSLFGTSADVGADNLTNATAIGNRAMVSQNNSLVLGSINGVNGAVADAKVGIGTTTPGFKLHIAGHTGSDWPIIKLQNVDPGGHSWWLYAGAGGTTTDLGIYDETLNAYRIYINGSNGNVGINTSPTDRLDVFGDIRVGAVFGCVRDRLSNVIAGTCGSDARLKRDITPFPKLLDKVAQLQPVNFYWRTEAFPERHFGRSQSFGLVAQEVEKVLPELVGEDESGYKVVHYNKLPLLMLEAIKELKAENDSFRQQIEQQQTKIDQQRQDIETLKKQRRNVDALKQLVCLDHPNADICRNGATP